MVIPLKQASAASLLILAGCATTGRPPAPALAHAPIANAAGASIGQARLEVDGEVVSLRVALTGLTPGTHGIHFHTTGSCQSPDFASAGAHLNPLRHQHGFSNPAGSHLGDLPNVEADAAGKVTTVIALRLTPAQVANEVLDADGTAIVVHAAADDYRTDPSGNSGARIACGVFAAG